MVDRLRLFLFITVFPLLSLVGASLAQDLGGFTCQDLIDSAAGKASRSPDGGKTYVPIRTPQPRDRFGVELLAHDTYNCQRLQRDEITVGQFNAERVEKINRLHNERQREALIRANVEAQRQQLVNQQRALQNQERSLQTQREGLEAQRESLDLQRQDMAERARQAEAYRRSQLEQQRIQQQQLEQIRQEQARPKSFSCFGGANYIQCQ